MPAMSVHMLHAQALLSSDVRFSFGKIPPTHTHTLSLLPVNPLAEDWCDQDLSQSVFPASAPGTQPKPGSSEAEASHAGTLD